MREMGTSNAWSSHSSKQGIQDNWFVTRKKTKARSHSTMNIRQKRIFRAQFLQFVVDNIYYTRCIAMSKHAWQIGRNASSRRSIVRVAEQANEYIYTLPFSFKNAKEQGRYDYPVFAFNIIDPKPRMSSLVLHRHRGQSDLREPQ